MLFNLHRDYVKAVAAPRRGTAGRDWSHAEHGEPPPRAMRASVARALVAVAGRVDRESARRALAS